MPLRSNLCAAGQGVTLRIRSHDGKPTNVAVVCTTGIGAHFAAEMFQVAGLDPWRAAVLVAKSPAGYRATYGAYMNEQFENAAHLLLSVLSCSIKSRNWRSLACVFESHCRGQVSEPAL